MMRTRTMTATTTFVRFFQNKSRRSDPYGPNIVRIRAIIVIFEPLNDFSWFVQPIFLQPIFQRAHITAVFPTDHPTSITSINFYFKQFVISTVNNIKNHLILNSTIFHSTSLLYQGSFLDISFSKMSLASNVICYIIKHFCVGSLVLFWRRFPSL